MNRSERGRAVWVGESVNMSGNVSTPASPTLPNTWATSLFSYIKICLLCNLPTYFTQLRSVLSRVLVHNKGHCFLYSWNCVAFFYGEKTHTHNATPFEASDSEKAWWKWLPIQIFLSSLHIFPVDLHLNFFPLGIRKTAACSSLFLNDAWIVKTGLYCWRKKRKKLTEKALAEKNDLVNLW